MTEDEKRNEHLKLVANLGNTLTAGVVTAGLFVPSAQFIFHLLPKETDPGKIVGIGAVCLVAGVALHIVSHLFLGSLK